MSVQETWVPTPRKIREDVNGGNVTDKVHKFSAKDFNTFLNGWEKVVKNYKTISYELTQILIIANPNILDFFLGFPGEDTGKDYFSDIELVVPHTQAILKGLNILVKNLIGKYEEENEILPLICYTHIKRGISKEMMKILNNSIIQTCSKVLRLHKHQVEAWKTVLEVIFQEYIYKYYPKEEEALKLTTSVIQ